MTCIIIDFPENFHPARLLIFQKIFPLHVYLGLFCPARLMFSKNFPTCTFIWSYTSIWHTRVVFDQSNGMNIKGPDFHCAPVRQNAEKKSNDLDFLSCKALFPTLIKLIKMSLELVSFRMKL